MLPYDRYGRVSRIGDRAERLQSRNWQDRETRQAAVARDIEPGEFFYDPDESGANPERDGLLEIIDRVEQGLSGGIVVAKLDRFSRDMRQALELAARIHDAGGRIISYAERSEWTTADGELQVHIALAFSHYTRRVLGESFEKSKASAVERGIPIQPRMVPGLRIVVGEGGVRLGVEHDENAPVMASLFARRANGAGPAELADFLRGHGVKTSLGSEHWSKAAIYGLIHNRAYLGELRQGEHANTEAWEPIVDLATWEAAQNPARPIAPRKAGAKSEHLLSALVRCYSCRHACVATTSSRGGRVYRCTVQHSGGRCPEPARAPADDLDAVVVEAFWTVAEDVHAQPSETIDTARVDELEQGVEKAERAFAMYRDDPELEATVEAMGGMGQWRDGLATHRRRMEAAKSELSAELAKHRGRPQLPPLAALRREWPNMPTAERRARIAEVIDTVCLLPRSSGLPLDERVVVFPAGTAPDDLPRRGYRQDPTLRPFPLPAKLGVGPVHVVGEAGS